MSVGLLFSEFVLKYDRKLQVIESWDFIWETELVRTVVDLPFELLLLSLGTLPVVRGSDQLVKPVLA